MERRGVQALVVIGLFALLTAAMKWPLSRATRRRAAGRRGRTTAIVDLTRGDIDSHIEFVLPASRVDRPRGPAYRVDNGLGPSIA
jgi:hypothetical protein